MLQEAGTAGAAPAKRWNPMRLLRGQRGQTTTEYAVILAIITPFLIATLALLAMAIAERLEFVARILS